MCWTYHDACGRSDGWEILWTSCPGLAVLENLIAFTTAAAVGLSRWFVVPFSWYSCCIVFACFRMKRKTKLLTTQRNWCEQLTTDLRWGVWTAFVCYEFSPFVHICVRLLVILSVTKLKWGGGGGRVWSYTGITVSRCLSVLITWILYFFIDILIIISGLCVCTCDFWLKSKFSCAASLGTPVSY